MVGRFQSLRLRGQTRGFAYRRAKATSFEFDFINMITDKKDVFVDCSALEIRLCILNNALMAVKGEDL